jgi:hypothetical protein
MSGELLRESRDMAKTESSEQTLVASSPKAEAQRLKDEVVRGFWKRGGRACVADLANDLPTSARALRPVVEQLEQDGVVRKVEDPKDPRKYAEPYQTIYELSR